METDLVAILKVQARTTTGSGRLFLTYPSYSKVYISRVVFFSSLVPEPEAMAFLVKNNHKSSWSKRANKKYCSTSHGIARFAVTTERSNNTLPAALSISLPPFHIRKRPLPRWGFRVHRNGETSIVNQHNRRGQTTIYKRGRGVELCTTKNNTSLVVIARLAPAVSVFQARSPNHLAKNLFSYRVSFSHQTWIFLHISTFTPLSLFRTLNSHLLLPLRTFLPLSYPGPTHLLHLWRLFSGQYRKTSRYEIPSSLIWYFSVTKMSNTMRCCYSGFLTLKRSEDLSKQIGSTSSFSRVQQLWLVDTVTAWCYSWFAKSQGCIVARSSIPYTPVLIKILLYFIVLRFFLNKKFSVYRNLWSVLICGREVASVFPQWKTIGNLYSIYMCRLRFPR